MINGRNGWRSDLGCSCDSRAGEAREGARFVLVDKAANKRAPNGPAERGRMIDKTVNSLHVCISVAVAKHYPDLHPDVPGSTKY